MTEEHHDFLSAMIKLKIIIVLATKECIGRYNNLK